MRLDALGSVFLILAAEAKNDVGDRLAEDIVFLGAPGLEGIQSGQAILLQARRLFSQTVSFGVVERAHVGFGHARSRAEDALLPAPGASAVTGHERFIVAPHHEMIAQRRLAGVLRFLAVVKAEEFLVRIRQEPGKNLGGGQVRVQLFGFNRHAKRIVIAADLHAFAAAFAEVGDENREEAAAAGRFLFQ